MYYNIFKREEKKYLLTQEQLDQLLSEISPHLVRDEYFKTTICNIYYDNQNNELIINSRENPPYKMKVRLRSYGIPNLDDPVFLEIKQKYKGIVEKRRIKLSLKEFYSYEETGIIKDEQIMKELDYSIKYYSLKPYIYLSYDRTSYRGKDNNNLRITFDTNLRYRFQDLKLNLGDKGKKYFKSPYYIMEIKALDSMPLWLVRTLSKLRIYPTSFSKVGKIYEKEFKRKGEIIHDK